VASLYKKPIVGRSPKTGEKVTKKSKKWWGRYTDVLGREKRVPLATDRRAAQAMLHELVQKVERQQAGLDDPAEEQMRRPIAEHLADFETYLRAKDVTDRHINESLMHIRKMIAAGRWRIVRDIGSASVTRFLGALRARGRSAQTYNHYLKAIKHFTRWLERERRIIRNPIVHLSRLNVKTDRRPIFRIRVLVLPLGQTFLIMQTLYFLPANGQEFVTAAVGLRQRVGGQVYLGHRQGLEKPTYHLVVDSVGRQRLAHRLAVLLSQVVAEILRTALVLQDHLVATTTAVDDALQQRLAVTGNASGLVAVILTVVVAEHVVDLLERFPGDVGRILIADTDFPLIDRQRSLPVFPGLFAPRRTRTTVSERPGVGGVLHHRTNTRYRGTFPVDIAGTILTRDLQLLFVEEVDNLSD